MLGGLCAAAITACSNNANRNATGTTGTAGSAGDQNAAVTVTGCLQQGGGMASNFILTQASSTSGAVGTTGSATDTNKVGNEQRAAAAKSYRLDGDKDTLNPLVGHQVRVSGRITDAGKIQTDQDRSANGSPSDIDAKDLAKISVDGVEKVADACGSPNPERR
jgi:hypothetical protein